MFEKSKDGMIFYQSLAFFFNIKQKKEVVKVQPKCHLCATKMPPVVGSIFSF